MPEPMFDPIANVDCGCSRSTSILVCGPFQAPINRDLGRCHANHVHIDCEAPVVNVNPIPATINWDAEGNPLFSEIQYP